MLKILFSEVNQDSNIHSIPEVKFIACLAEMAYLTSNYIANNCRYSTVTGRCQGKVILYSPNSSIIFFSTLLVGNLPYTINFLTPPSVITNYTELSLVRILSRRNPLWVEHQKQPNQTCGIPQCGILPITRKINRRTYSSFS